MSEPSQAGDAHARRQAALVRMRERLAGRPPVSEEDRRAVRDEVHAELEGRGAELARDDRT